MIVMEYMEMGDLLSYLQKNYKLVVWGSSFKMTIKHVFHVFLKACRSCTTSSQDTAFILSSDSLWHEIPLQDAFRA